jgi:hypothetical protein
MVPTTQLLISEVGSIIFFFSLIFLVLSSVSAYRSTSPLVCYHLLAAMMLNVSLLAVLATVAVVVQAGHSFEKLPAQRAALGKHASISARNKGGDSTPKLWRTHEQGSVSYVSDSNADRKEAYCEFYAPV